MNNLKLYLFIWINFAACMLMYSSCTDDIIYNNQNAANNEFNNNDCYVSVVLNATIDNLLEPSHILPTAQNSEIESFECIDKFQSGDTKSPTAIRSLMLFQYDNTGQLIHNQTIGDLTSLTNIPIKLKKGANHKIIFISNATQINWSDKNLYSNLEQIKKLQYNYALIENDEDVPLIGSTDVDLVTENLRIENVKLTRVAAKVMFMYSDVNAKYKVKHVSLMNTPSTMYLFNTDDDSVYPLGNVKSHTMHPSVKYAKDYSGEMVWYMPINRRGKTGTAKSPKDKTEQTAPSGQGQYASYLSIYCENLNPDAIIKDGICSIYLGSNDPKNYNIKANKKYSINTRFSGSEIPTDDPRVEGNIGNFVFDFDIIDDEVFKTNKISNLTMDINGRKTEPSISLTHIQGRKYRVSGRIKLEHRDNTLTYLSFQDSYNNVLSGYRNNKQFYLEGDVHRKIDNTHMYAYFSGLFCGLGNGSNSYPYEVCSANTLSSIRDLSKSAEQANRYIKQVKDVDLQNEPWTPIPSFQLNFDGNYHQITNLNIRTNADQVGLFAVVTKHNTVIKNVTIGSGYIAAGNYVGGIAGRVLEGATLINCKNYATVLASENVGGICGEFHNYNKLSECENHGKITGFRSVGGIAGIYRCSTLEKCRNFGSISASSNGVGGIAGVADQDHNTYDCYNRGEIRGQYQVGGIEGFSRANQIRWSYNCGSIYASASYAGGIIGESVAGGPEFHICYNHASINARGVSGGIAGRVNGTIKLYNVYHIGEFYLEGDDVAGGICGEASTIEALNPCYTACYTQTKPSFAGKFGHIIAHCSYYNLNKTFYLNDKDQYKPVGKGKPSLSQYPTGISERQLRGQSPIMINNRYAYILTWLNNNQYVWQQSSNSFPYLSF